MGLAFLELVTRNLPVMFIALFLRGIQGSCYSPSKFGMLAEILPEKKLSQGNGLLELGSFVAIICGTVAGTSMYTAFSPRLGSAGMILLATTLVGLAAAATLPLTQVEKTARQFVVNPFRGRNKTLCDVPTGALENVHHLHLGEKALSIFLRLESHQSLAASRCSDRLSSA